jgi:hypothetical protein
VPIFPLIYYIIYFTDNFKKPAISIKKLSILAIKIKHFLNYCKASNIVKQLCSFFLPVSHGVFENVGQLFCSCRTGRQRCYPVLGEGSFHEFGDIGFGEFNGF